MCFNPRPGLATGATWPRAPWRRNSCVSIRAPVSRPGRLFLRHGEDDRHEFQSAPRSRDRGDCDLPNWPSRKDFVAHFRQPASFSCTSNVCDVKEQGKFCVAATLSPRRETPASKPSLMVRGSVVIESAVRSNLPAFPPHDVQFSVSPFHPDNKIAANPRRF